MLAAATTHGLAAAGQPLRHGVHLRAHARAEPAIFPSRSSNRTRAGLPVRDWPSSVTVPADTHDGAVEKRNDATFRDIRRGGSNARALAARPSKRIGRSRTPSRHGLPCQDRPADLLPLSKPNRPSMHPGQEAFVTRKLPQGAPLDQLSPRTVGDAITSEPHATSTQRHSGQPQRL